MPALRCISVLMASCLALVALATPAHAQYFGQNKVQYERFDFQVLRTDHFDIYYYPEERDAIQYVAVMAEAWYTRLQSALGLPLSSRQPLVMYASQPHFGQTQVVEGLIGESTGGVTELLKRRMVLPFAGTLGETHHVLGHEMVHAFQFDLGGQDALTLPLWFIEGMAEYLTLGPNHPQTAMWLRSLAQKPELPGFEDLHRAEYFPYRFGHAAWAFLVARYGPKVVTDAFLAAVQARDPIAGIEAATGERIETLSAAWRTAIRERHNTSGASPAIGREVVSGDTPRQGRLHVSPSISPDGRWLVYLSERGLFSIDYVLADAATGRVVRRLTSSATQTHIESLQFVNSAGAWDAASARFAFTTVRGGAAVLTIADIAAGGRTRDIPLTTVDDAWHPTWAPDGRAIAFSGHRGGFSDLYVLDLDSGQVRQLTQDAFADLHPAWAPTGDHIAFVTDRFTTQLERVQFGALRLATIAVTPEAGTGTATIQALPSLDGATHINPHWVSASSLAFVGDPDGVPNVYQLDVQTGRFSQVTAVDTGVSGLTPLSPALSVAPGAGTYAYGVFTQGGYDIRIAPLTAASPAPRTGTTRAGVLFATRDAAASPGPASSTPVSSVDVAGEPYRPRLSLDFIGASGGIGVSGVTGAFAAGGIGMQFSDVLNDHSLGLIVQANGGVRDLGAQATYINRRSRWNWGALVGVVPYATGALNERLDQVNGFPAIVQEALIFRQTDLQTRGIAMYPFSRASRFELQAGARRIWFDRSLTTRVYSFDTGELLAEDERSFDAPESLNLADATAALVYDQVTFGPVGPLNGQRYRFDVTPTFGSIRYTSLLLDYRRYLTPVRPFTLAVRGLHVGRYGDGGEDSRLSPLFLGYSSLVRGYDVNSFDTAECGAIADSCPTFDRLIGSRIMVANAELRVPLLGLLTGDYRYGPVPIEAFAFADTGVAWSSTSSPARFGGERDWVSSVGFGARVNVFGYVVVQAAAARPLNRLTRGWRFVLDFSPAF